MKKIIYILILLLIISACSFSKNNPVDPVYSGINAPAKVTGLDGESYSNRIEIRWNSITGASGYYVYRSMVFDGIYERIADVPAYQGISLYSYSDLTEYLNPGKWYKYKISAYVEVDYLLFLEGERSELIQFYVPY